MNRNRFDQKKLTGALSHPRKDITPAKQAVLDECQQWLDNGGDRGAEMPEELWQKYWAAFRSEIESECDA